MWCPVGILLEGADAMTQTSDTTTWNGTAEVSP